MTVNPEEFLQSLAPGVRARVEALKVSTIWGVGEGAL
jgi:hypothetical protein